MPYKLHSVVIYPDALGAEVKIGDLLSESVSINPEFLVDRSAGSQYPDHVALTAASPDLTFETFNIVDLLDAVGISGLCIEAATNPGVDVYLQKIDECGKVASGSVHRKLTFLAGLLVVDQVTAGHRENARAQAKLHGISDGTNNGITIVDNAALPTGVSTRNRWTLGDQQVGGVAITDHTQLTINLGNQVTKRGVQSNFENVYIEQLETSPEFDIQGINTAWFSASVVPYTGIALTHANTFVYLRKRQTDGVGFVSSVTTEHIKFTMAGVGAINQAAGASENNYSEASIRCVGQVDGSGNAPLSYDGAIAHP